VDLGYEPRVKSVQVVGVIDDQTLSVRRNGGVDLLPTWYDLWSANRITNGAIGWASSAATNSSTDVIVQTACFSGTWYRSCPLSVNESAFAIRPALGWHRSRRA
jgi:hypothetical protein